MKMARISPEGTVETVAIANPVTWPAVAARLGGEWRPSPGPDGREAAPGDVYNRVNLCFEDPA